MSPRPILITTGDSGAGANSGVQLLQQDVCFDRDLVILHLVYNSRTPN